MKIPLSKTDFRENINAFMRHCGYIPFYDSYVRQLGTGGYPRFHVYIDEKEKEYVLNLHLDQKRPSYGKETAHSGDYEGRPVETEAERIEDILHG